MQKVKDGNTRFRDEKVTKKVKPLMAVGSIIISKVVCLIQECLHLDSEGRINDRGQRTHTVPQPQGYICYDRMGYEYWC